MNDDTVIKIDGLWKRYGFPLTARLRQYKNIFKSGAGQEEHWALKDINLDLKKGETLGVIGRNGAGKSTLLKVLAGVTPPSRGSIDIRGRLFPMIELNAGIHMELTGRENVFLLGSIMGLTRSEIREKFPQIEEFCELGDWFDEPVRKYSSGMLARLGFGVAMNVDADLLLIDEVLGVGDIAFQRKCYTKLEDMYDSDQSILFVSHNLHQISRVCTNVVIIENAEVIFSGPTKEGINKYELLTQKHRKNEQAKLTDKTGIGTVLYDFEEISLVDVALNGEKEKFTEIEAGSAIEIEMKFSVREKQSKAKFNVIIENVRAEPVTWHYIEVTDIEKGEYNLKQNIDELWLAPGVYEIRIGVGVGEIQRRSLNVRNVISFTVKSKASPLGFYHPPCKWEWSKENKRKKTN